MKWVGRFRVPIKASPTDTTDEGLFSDTSECEVIMKMITMKWDEALPHDHNSTVFAQHYICMSHHSPHLKARSHQKIWLNKTVQLSHSVWCEHVKDPTQQNSLFEMSPIFWWELRILIIFPTRLLLSHFAKYFHDNLKHDHCMPWWCSMMLAYPLVVPQRA
jgi:hypothetical protein